MLNVMFDFPVCATLLGQKNFFADDPVNKNVDKLLSK